MASVLAVLETRDGALRPVSREVLSAARSVAEAIGARTDALVFGSGDPSEAARYGANRILVVSGDDVLRMPDVMAATVAAHARDDVFAVVFGATSAGKDLAPRVAARLDVPLAGDATALDVEGGELVVTRPLYAGRAFVRLTLAGSPRAVSIRPNVFRAVERAGAGEVVNVDAAGEEADRRVRVREVVAAAGAKLDVGEAPIVVSGGRGLKGPENWHLLESLRDALGDRAALGASRAVVDEGWRPHGEQVGQTGKTVSPQLYIAVGISGAMQHLAGMRSATTIVAINRDADAPIFKVADYGVVGDAHEILPRLTEEIRRVRGG